ncbi:2-(1,2-epoxy-1,2-dihydrophenyl)acetyl-CoA isomerase PaaG [Sulfitobacter sp. S223]|uniref:2-(1,2-epoxy-1,2-dihydrophenyl)acetyl-CoA isomerase PaaG n=1 Tax=Sulfitobacter sp. S223 TaxID=2867023 RepID=UPI0021A46C5E|nr:2-(1,2-epoxy-1,2-dihydrophenyl)acetyl-CoA isomerase PaaG [Sulfitobacter sp. S223]UWR25250.1 2-(1,2-epoxy-1,2-dihydrophenyl)acetyl-CoA isomerase PaaG [Sulfitobacter sp. S223]
MSDTIQIEDHGLWVEITLNRPDRLNSFNEEMHLALRAALEDAKAKRAVLLTGAGRGFCAGQDLGERDPAKMDTPPDLGQTVRQFWAPLVRQLRGLEMPVVCAVNGVAAGAGSSLAINCDMVFAAQSARFIQSFGKVGLIPDTGGSWQLTRLLGPARARGLALTSEPLTASQAAEWGLIWKACPDDALMEEARALTAKLASGPTFGYASTKRAIDAAATNTLDDHLELEADLMKACGESIDYAEGVSAFLNKRAPVFLGR